MINISEGTNRPDKIWIEERLTEDGRWVEKRRWTKPDSFPFDYNHRKAYITMMLDANLPSVRGIRFVEGTIFWEIHEVRVADGR